MRLRALAIAAALWVAFFVSGVGFAAPEYPTFGDLPGAPSSGELGWIRDGSGIETVGEVCAGGGSGFHLCAWNAGAGEWRFVQAGAPTPPPGAPPETFLDAVQVAYENSTSGLTGTTSQAALDELAGISAGAIWTVVAALPSPPGNPNQTYIVTDGNALNDCTTGTGALNVHCSWTGAAWQALGGGAAFTPNASPSSDHSSFNAETDARIGVHTAIPGAHHTEFSPDASPSADHGSFNTEADARIAAAAANVHHDQTTVFGRSHPVSALAGDYDAGQITVTPTGTITETDAQAALAGLDSRDQTAAGADNQIQYAAGGDHGSESDFTYDPVTNTLAADNLAADQISVTAIADANEITMDGNADCDSITPTGSEVSLCPRTTGEWHRKNANREDPVIAHSGGHLEDCGTSMAGWSTPSTVKLFTRDPVVRSASWVFLENQANVWDTSDATMDIVVRAASRTLGPQGTPVTAFAHDIIADWTVAFDDLATGNAIGQHVRDPAILADETISELMALSYIDDSWGSQLGCRIDSVNYGTAPAGYSLNGSCVVVFDYKVCSGAATPLAELSCSDDSDCAGTCDYIGRDTFSWTVSIPDIRNVTFPLCLSWAYPDTVAP